jgi:hypothetical protein
MQGLYAKLATCPPFEWMFSTAVIEIDPWLDEIENWCILPGNHSLRIINFEKQVCEVILKDGFNQKFLANEIKIRSTFSHPSIPKLLSASVDADYYVEERIQGVPLNRLSKRSDRNFCLQQSKECLAKLSDETREMRKLQDWLVHLRNKLNMCGDFFPNERRDNQWSEIIQLSKDLLCIAEVAGEEVISTTITHGDFQPANVIYSNNKQDSKVFLIDWEYAGRRFEPYDKFVYFFRSRFPEGLGTRLLELQKDSFSADDSYNWPDLRSTGPHTSWALAVLLLEDLLVRVGESSVPSYSGVNLGLGIFLQEIRAWLNKN